MGRGEQGPACPHESLLRSDLPTYSRGTIPAPKGAERPVGGEDGSFQGAVHSGLDVSPDCRISKKSSLSLKHL